MNMNHISFERLFIDKKLQLRLSSINFSNTRGGTLESSSDKHTDCMFLVLAHTIYVYSSWKHRWSERQLPSFMEDKEVFLHVQDWWLYPVKTHSPRSEVQLPVHTKRTAFFFFKTHKIQSFLNSLPSQFPVLTPRRPW